MRGGSIDWGWTLQRTRRWGYLALSVLGIAVGLWGFARLPTLSEFPPGFAPPGTWPIQVEGVPAGSAAELRLLAQSRAPGAALVLRGAAGSAELLLGRQLTNTHLALTLVDGLLFLIVNLLVFVPRLDRPPARPFYWLTLVTGTSILIGGLYLPRAGSVPDTIAAAVWLACLTFLPVFFTRLGLEFPRRRSWLARAPWAPRGLLVVAALLTAWQVAAYLRYFARPDPAAWRAAALPRLLAQGLLVAGVAAGLLLLLRSLRLVQLTRERQQLKWLIWGFAIGVTPYVFLRTLPLLFGLRPPFGPAFDRVCEMTVPLAFTLAVVRWKFLDIDIIIRRSLLYTLLAGVLTGVYLLVAVLAGARVREALPAAAPWIPVVAALAAAGLYAPTRRALGTWIDRTFFRIRYGHATALRGFQAALPAAAGPQEVAERLCGLLVETLELKGGAALTAGGGALADAGLGPAAALAASAELPRAPGAAILAAPEATSLPELESADYPPALRAAGAPLAVPLTADPELLGWLLLGEKRSERRFIEQDLELIAGAAASAAAALERIRLVRRAAAEEAARQRLGELDRLKSDFLSRVAHDLRTPLTSLQWSADNLLDGVAGPTTPRQAEYLQSMKAATGQLGRLVNNLLGISRLEVGRPGVTLGPVDLRAVVAEAALALAPVAAGRGVTIAVSEPGTGAAPLVVRGDREKLAEVVANLLENAVRYSPDGGVVEVAVEAAGLAPDGAAMAAASPPGTAAAPTAAAAAKARLLVRDHGPGLAEGEAEFVFDRFRQGRPSPYAAPSGFGLGLYVVKSYVTLMGGAVGARNHPGGGAEFACELPPESAGRAARASPRPPGIGEMP